MSQGPPTRENKYDYINNAAERIDSAWTQINLMCGIDFDNLHHCYFEIYDKLLYNRERFLNFNRKEYLEKFTKWLTQN